MLEVLADIGVGRAYRSLCRSAVLSLLQLWRNFIALGWLGAGLLGWLVGWHD
jgi:hypothetical protein